MFNSPLLSIFIGIILLYLLFSLLATAIVETIASSLKLRGRTLRSAIFKTLLSDGPDTKSSYLTYLWTCYKLWLSGIIKSAKYIFKPVSNESKLADDFYRNPKITKLSESRRFPKPSYIPETIFSDVISDILNNYFNTYKEQIKAYFEIPQEKIDSLTDIEKITFLLNFFTEAYDNNTLNNLPIDYETLKLLKSYLTSNDLVLNLSTYKLKLEEWYNNTIDRISGWYKRQTQLILFVIGLVIACTWNIDIVNYSNELAKNEQMSKAIAEYPSKLVSKNDSLTTGKSKDKVMAIITEIEPNLPIGWRNYVLTKTKSDLPKGYHTAYDTIYRKLFIQNSGNENKALTKMIHQQTMATIYDTNSTELSLHFFRKSLSFQKIIGYLLFALGICLGAPFWFDLLQKFTKIRGTGKPINDNNSKSITTNLKV